MKSFQIDPVTDVLHAELQDKINKKTKPIGSLGKLEALALRIGAIQSSLSPQLHRPSILVFAGDHGIAADGVVSPCPQDVTWQMVYNFLAGGAGINVFSKQHGIELTVVDSGVNHDFDPHPELIDAKLGYGTKNYLHEPAMSDDLCEAALAKGAEIVRSEHAKGSNVIGFGEMGIGNTSSAALLMSAIVGIPIEDCVGPGAGLTDDGVRRKAEALAQAQRRHPDIKNSMELLATFGGFEVAMMCGAMLQAAELNMVVLIDGYIATSSLLVAAEMHPEVLGYCLFSHGSKEQGHAKMLDHFNASPLLDLQLRLGEGTGAALCYPLLQSALCMMNEMASFEDANVTSPV